MKHYKNVLIVFIFMVCLSGCSFLGKSVDLRYGENADADRVWTVADFEDLYAVYWGSRFSRNPVESFKIEAPYFQEMIPFARYESYVNAQKNKLLYIEVDRVVQETQGLYKVFSKMHLKMQDGSNREVDMSDPWVHVKGKWYHVLKDYFVFPEVSR